MKYILSEGSINTGMSWDGSPVSCAVCTTESPDCFVQGRLDPSSPHANFLPTVTELCLPCFKIHGRGIGKGLGHKYCKQQ